MLDINQIVKEVSKRTGIDKEVVDKVCKFPFIFTVDVMKDEMDTHSVLFNKLFKFKLKGRFAKDKTKQYSPKI